MRGRNGGGAQSYRYAPLSSGLDIVRKTFGKYELAVDADDRMSIASACLSI